METRKSLQRVNVMNIYTSANNEHSFLPQIGYERTFAIGTKYFLTFVILNIERHHIRYYIIYKDLISYSI